MHPRDRSAGHATTPLWVPALLLLGIAGCGGDPAPPLRIGTLVWPGYEPLYLARDLGYLEDRSVPPLARSGRRRLMEVMLAEGLLLRAPTEVDALFAPAPLEPSRDDGAALLKRSCSSPLPGS